MAQDAKQLEKLLKVCRKFGVLEIESDGLKIKLSQSTPTKSRARREQTSIDDTPFYTDEQLATWSAPLTLESAG